VPLTIERVAIDGATREALTPLGLPDVVADDWARFAGPQVRTLLVARGSAGDVAGAAITSGRPLAGYLKIGGIWTADAVESAAAADDEAAAWVVRELVAAAERLAWESGFTVVKWEHRPGEPGAAAASGYFGPATGYVAVPAPGISAPIPNPRPDVPSAWFKWRTATPLAAVPYMRQTTDFTCGTASLSMLLAGSGLIAEPSRAQELALWRQATTVVGCDPYGLAVTAGQQGLHPLVVINTQDTLFTEDLKNEQERELRAFIQAGFRDEVGQWGIETELRAFDIADLRAVLASGGTALVLVDTVLVTGDLCPHWIFAHSLHHDAEAGEYFLIHDPWTEWEQGESWVDAYNVPLTADALDKIAWTGTPAVRAMLTFTAG
jgi:hypothetical protein